MNPKRSRKIRPLQNQTTAQDTLLKQQDKMSRYDDSGRRADGRKQIKGFSPAQHESQPIANPFRGLDGITGPRAPIVANTKNLGIFRNSPNPFGIPQGRGSPIDQKAAANDADKAPAKSTDSSIIGEIRENTKVIALRKKISLLWMIQVLRISTQRCRRSMLLGNCDSCARIRHQSEEMEIQMG